MSPNPPDAELIEAGRRLFAGRCDFVRSVVDEAGLPQWSQPEIALAGRSNVGKSSLVNALTGRKTLAKVSNTPGRTRQLNFFDLGGRLGMVDLPGYGFARAPLGDVRVWQRLTAAYLSGRPGLRRVLLLLDGRHGLKDIDREVLGLLDQAAVPYQIILTKADKVSRAEMAGRVAGIGDELRSHPAALGDILVTSSAKRWGIEELRAELARLAGDG